MQPELNYIQLLHITQILSHLYGAIWLVTTNFVQDLQCIGVTRHRLSQIPFPDNNFDFFVKIST